MDTNADVRMDTVEMAAMATVLITAKISEEKRAFAYIAGGVAGSVVFLILLVLLIWMICVRANRTRKTPEKILSAAADQNGSQVNFYYGAPAPYAESIAPSHHS